MQERSFKTRQQQSNWNQNSLNSPDLGFCLHTIHCGIEIVHTVYRFFELSIIGFQSITCVLDNDKIRSLLLILGTFESLQILVRKSWIQCKGLGLIKVFYDILNLTFLSWNVNTSAVFCVNKSLCRNKDISLKEATFFIKGVVCG